MFWLLSVLLSFVIFRFESQDEIEKFSESYDFDLLNMLATFLKNEILCEKYDFKKTNGTKLQARYPF